MHPACAGCRAGLHRQQGGAGPSSRRTFGWPVRASQKRGPPLLASRGYRLDCMSVHA